MREELQSSLTTEDNIVITDPTSVDWNSFSFDRGFNEHVITKEDIYRPYLIAEKFYQNTDLTDIILLLNNVDDVFNLQVGAKLAIPFIEDLEEFIVAQKALNANEN